MSNQWFRPHKRRFQCFHDEKDIDKLQFHPPLVEPRSPKKICFRGDRDLKPLHSSFDLPEVKYARLRQNGLDSLTGEPMAVDALPYLVTLSEYGESTYFNNREGQFDELPQNARVSRVNALFDFDMEKLDHLSKSAVEVCGMLPEWEQDKHKFFRGSHRTDCTVGDQSARQGDISVPPMDHDDARSGNFENGKLSSEEIDNSHDDLSGDDDGGVPERLPHDEDVFQSIENESEIQKRIRQNTKQGQQTVAFANHRNCEVSVFTAPDTYVMRDLRYKSLKGLRAHLRALRAGHREYEMEAISTESCKPSTYSEIA